MEQPLIAEEKTYRLSRAGRRVAGLLLAGSVLIWLFALWTLKNTLKIGLRPQNILPSLKLLAKRLLGLEGAPPLTVEEAIPAIVMLVLAVIVPLLMWNLVEELRASYRVGPAGITFRSLAVELSYPWSEIVALRPVDPEEKEAPLDELVVRTSRLSTIRGGLARFLHWQAYGRNKLPLYGGIEERDDLLARIRAHMAAAEGQPAAVEPIVEALPVTPAAEALPVTPAAVEPIVEAQPVVAASVEPIVEALPVVAASVEPIVEALPVVAAAEPIVEALPAQEAGMLPSGEAPTAGEEVAPAAAAGEEDAPIRG